MLERLRKLFAKSNKEEFKTHGQMGEIAHADPLNLFPGGFQQFNPSDLVARKGLRVYDQMRMDDQVKAAMNLKKYAVLSPSWEISPKDNEISKFVENALNSMDERFEDSLWEILSALEYGYSINEKVWARRNDSVIIDAIKGRKPHTFTFDVDVFGNIDAVIQEDRAPIGGDGPFPRFNPNKFVIYSYQKEFGNPYGRSDLEAAYTPWWHKTNTLKWMAMFLERFGIPPIFGFYNPNFFSENQVEELKTVLERMQASTTGLIPRPDPDAFDTWTPNSEFAASQTQRTFIPALDRQDQMIARAVLMPGMIGMTPEGKGGSFARSQTHFGTFLIVVEALQLELARLINSQVIRPLVEMNFSNPSFIPTFQWLPLTDEMKLDLADQWANQVDKGTVTPTSEDQDHIRRILNFPDKGDSEDPPGPDNAPTPKEPDDTVPTGGMNTQEFQEAIENLEEEIGGIEEEVARVISDKAREEVDRIISKVKREGLDPQTVQNLQSRVNVKRDLKKALSQAFEKGKETQTKTKEESQFLETLAVSLASLISFQVVDGVKESLLGSIDREESVSEAISNIRNSLESWTSKDNPSRVKNLVRTEVNKTYQKGKVDAVEPDGEVKAFRYVAESGGSHQACRFMHNRLIPVGSRFLSSLRPPLHHNCRSTLVPVTREVSDNELISPSQAGRAIQLAEPRFA